MVQFVLPVDNPVNNVRKYQTKGVITFEVPLNYPNVHTVTYRELCEAVWRAAKLDLSTKVNTDTDIVHS